MAMPFTRQNIQTHQDLREKKKVKKIALQSVCYCTIREPILFKKIST